MDWEAARCVPPPAAIAVAANAQAASAASRKRGVFRCIKPQNTPSGAKFRMSDQSFALGPRGPAQDPPPASGPGIVPVGYADAMTGEDFETFARAALARTGVAVDDVDIA